MAYKKIHFIKANPSSNTTVFVLDPLPRENYASVAAFIMENTVLCAEQVGFIEKPANPQALSRMHMMGGEFCGNASRSFAAWLALGGKHYLAGKNAAITPLAQAKSQVTIEVSGYEGLLTAQLEDIGCPFGCFAEISMPLPQFVRHDYDSDLGSYSLVGFEGIIHVVLWQKAKHEKYFKIVKEFLPRQGLDNSCFGIMFTDENKGLGIEPLVYVEKAGSLVWESSCGSGSLAVAAAIADRDRQSLHRLKISQPGGDLFVGVDWDKGFRGAQLAGDVFLTAVGTAYISI